jgi:hypothetical protein
VTDQVPGRFRRNLRHLFEGFLHPIFAKIPLPCGKGLGHDGRRLSLGNSNQANGRCGPPRAARRFGDPVAHLREIFSDGRHDPG